MREQILSQTPSLDTLTSWPTFVEHLFDLGWADLAHAKLAEAHLDALRIHHEAGTEPVAGEVYAVWASRSRGTGLTARRADDCWRLDGTLAFASGGGIVGRALVPVWVGENEQQLLDVDVSGWHFDTSRWRTTAMVASRTGSTTLHDIEVDAVAIGGDGFYLDRPGFFAGGVGVAAVWAGGARRLADLVEEAVPPAQRSSGQRIRLGRIRADVAAACAVCRDFARVQPMAVPGSRERATLARAAVAAAARRALEDARAVVGAVGLAANEPLIGWMQDLTLYLSQQNADADADWLGER